MTGARIVERSKIPADTTYLFRVRGSDAEETVEALLVDLADGVGCWRNECQHFTHIPIDKGSGAPMRNGELVCANHGAMFDAATGECTFGPCEGAYLEPIDVVVEDGVVYLDDGEYEYVGDGPADDGDDLTSSSNVKF